VGGTRMTTRTGQTVWLAAGLSVVLAAASAVGDVAGQPLPKLPIVAFHRQRARAITYARSSALKALPQAGCSVFKVVARTDLDDQVRRTAEILGIHGPLESRWGGLGLMVREGPPVTSKGAGPRAVGASRLDDSIEFSDHARQWQGRADGSPTVLPQQEQAWAIAEQFLADSGLDTADKRRECIMYMMEGDHKIGMTVRFRRAINGLPIRGPGGKAFVDLGDGGQVTGLLYVWRAIQPLGVYPLRTVDEAIADLNVRKPAVTAIPPGADRAEFNQAELAYWEDIIGVAQDTVQPVYVLKGRAFKGSVDIGEVEAIVAAVASTHVTEGAPPSGPPS